MPSASPLSFSSSLPDIFCELFHFFGWRSGRLFSHSIVFALSASLGLFYPMSRLGPFSFRRAFAIPLVSILIHDLLDLLQHTDRMPLWPAIKDPVTTNLIILPSEPHLEVLLFGSAFLLLSSLYLIRTRDSKPPIASTRKPLKGRLPLWISRGLIIAITVSAGLTHYLRNLRDEDLRQARSFLQGHDYEAVIKKATAAERWPSTAKPGRTDYLRAVAYENLGNRKAAEQYYLRSYAADSDYF